MPHALIVDDDSVTLESLAELVAARDFSVATAGDLAGALEAIDQRRPDVVLCDLILPDGRGMDLLQNEQAAGIDVILITGHATLETAVEALRQGAFDYLTKPLDVPRLEALLTSLRRTLALRGRVSELREELRRLGRFGRLVGSSSPMQRVYDLIDKVSHTDATVFVIGESGTGKELVAETVHELSPRRDGSFLPLNCGAVSPNLIESELFGHERGSFTGASRSHRGHFERADGGTLFLDEITEMPVELQVKLLRVLETGVLLRVGGDRPIEVDVRVVAATNRDPQRARSEGLLREDLYYRLNVFPIHLPPLRERGEDIDALALHFLSELNEDRNDPKTITPAAVARLRKYHWPGNVRELKNVVQRSFILADREITPEGLPGELGGEGPGETPRYEIGVGLTLDEAKRRLLLATLEQTATKKEAAEVLGVSLKTLYNNLKRYERERSGSEDV
jgi:DNA-binding NtrC family response regulator